MILDHMPSVISAMLSAGAGTSAAHVMFAIVIGHLAIARRRGGKMAIGPERV